jgi:hypothetical protein
MSAPGPACLRAGATVRAGGRPAQVAPRSLRVLTVTGTVVLVRPVRFPHAALGGLTRRRSLDSGAKRDLQPCL